MSTVFSHRPWSEVEATELRAQASTRLAARARRNQRINHALMAVCAFCFSLAVVWRERPIAPWLTGFSAAAFFTAIHFARAGLDHELELRRWEFDNGFPPATSARIESILADSSLPPELPAAVHRWQALGYTLRRRDIDFLLSLAGRTDAASASDEYFSYVLLREDA